MTYALTNDQVKLFSLIRFELIGMIENFHILLYFYWADISVDILLKPVTNAIPKSFSIDPFEGLF